MRRSTAFSEADSRFRELLIARMDENAVSQQDKTHEVQYSTCEKRVPDLDEELVALLQHEFRQRPERELTPASIVLLSLLLDGHL
jgi:hypothetical protein